MMVCVLSATRLTKYVFIAKVEDKLDVILSLVNQSLRVEWMTVVNQVKCTELKFGLSVNCSELIVNELETIVLG